MSMSQRIIAIGDIHGCATALSTLIDAVNPQHGDIVVALGDFIDRGPDSRAVIEQLLSLGKRCSLVPLLGNHDEMLLAVLARRSDLRGWRMDGGGWTIDSYGGVDKIPASHVEFLSSCRNYYETETHFFVHANYDADTPLERQNIRLLRHRSLDQHPPRPHYSGRVAIVGHTAQVSGEILDMGFLKCIDTHCYGGRWLTALEVSKGQVWQASDEGRLR